MLRKSCLGAITMSAIAVFSTALTAGLVLWMRFRTQVGEISGPQTFLILLFVFILIVLPGALLIYPWNEAHFGPQGAIRWGIFGLICGILLSLLAMVLVPFEDTLDRGVLSFFIKKGLSVVVSLGVAYIAHRLAFGWPKREMLGPKQISKP